MTQALFTSMTGLNAGTEQLTVVSDNVANMNTEDTNIDLTDRYSKWEEELKERERAVIEAEKKYQKFTE